MRSTLRVGARAGILLMLPLLAVAAVLGIIAAPAATAATLAAAPIVGAQSVDNLEAAWLSPDVDPVLTMMDIANDVPFDQFMRKIPGRKKKVESVKTVFYRRDRALQRIDAANGAVSAVAAPGTASVVVDTPTMWVEGDLILLPDNATTPDAFLVVTAVNYATSTLTVAGLPKDTNGAYKTPDAYAGVPAIADNEEIIRLSPARTEGDAPRTPRANASVEDYNFQQTYADNVEWTKHAEFTANWTRDKEYQIRRRETLTDLRRSINNDLMHGVRTKTRAENGEIRWTQGGLLSANLDTFSFSAGSLSESQVIDFLYQSFTGNAGSRTRFLLCGRDIAKAFDKVMLTKLQHTEKRTVLGVETRAISGGPGMAYIVYDPSFDSLNKHNEGVLVDFESLYKAQAQPFTRTPVDYRKSGVKDAEGEWFQEICALEVHRPDAHVHVVAT